MTCTHRRARRAAAAAALAGALALSGCAGDDTEPATDDTDSSEPAEETVDPEQEQAEQNVLATYGALWSIKIEMLSTPTPHNPDLVSVVGQDVGAELRDSAHWLAVEGDRMSGEPVTDPDVSEVDLAADPATASITDCVDYTNYIQVDSTSEEPSYPDVERGTLEATATLQQEEDSDHGWLVTEFELDSEVDAC